MTIRINRIPVEIATTFFNAAISFVPCFKYADSEDAILFTSRHIHYLVDKAGQFNENYYGMKHELIECITSEQGFVDLNDEHVFKAFKLSELLTESKTVLYALYAGPCDVHLGFARAARGRAAVGLDHCARDGRRLFISSVLAIVRSVVGSRDKYVRDSCVRARQRGVSASLRAPPSRARRRQARARAPAGALPRGSGSKSCAVASLSSTEWRMGVVNSMMVEVL